MDHATAPKPFAKEQAEALRKSLDEFAQRVLGKEADAETALQEFLQQETPPAQIWPSTGWWRLTA